MRQDWSMHEYPLNLCSYCYQLQQEMGELRRDAALLPACSSDCRSIETGFRQGVLMLNDADLCTLINGSCVGCLQAGTKNSIMCGNGTLCHARKYSGHSLKNIQFQVHPWLNYIKFDQYIWIKILIFITLNKYIINMFHNEPNLMELIQYNKYQYFLYKFGQI